MISSIRIQNRQSHSDTTVHLHPGINVIVGRGTSGKSAIIRALRWPLENTSGTSQISRWIMREPKGKSKDLVLDGETAVTITKPQGTLRRFRNPDANGYEVNGKTLKAVGTGVPEEVQAFFNLSDINIQGQHDAPFLISLPGSQVSAYLNRVVGIEEINTYMKVTASCLKKSKDKVTQLQAEQEADQKTLEALGWIDGIQASLDALDQLDADKKLKETRLQGVCHLVGSLEAEHTKKGQASKVARLSEAFQEVKKLAQAVQGVASKLAQVSRLVAAWEDAEITRDKAFRVAKLSSDLEVCRKLEAEGLGASSRRDRLLTWMESYRTNKESLIVASKVAGLSGKLDACKAVSCEISTKTEEIKALGAWDYKMHVYCSSLERERKLVALEPLVLKVRKTAKVLEGRKKELESLDDWGLTFQGFQSRLGIKRSEVSDLEAKRPETCPLCGGAYGKEKYHA